MPQQVDVNSVRKGGYLLIDEEPCKVKSVNKSSPGKHGAAKYKIRAEGVFDGQTRNMVEKGGTKLLTPDIQKKVGQVVSIDGEIAQIMDMDTYQTEEMKLPEDLDVSEGEEIMYWDIEGRKLVKGKNEN